MPSSTPRPRASLVRVLDDLGATLLDLVHGDTSRVDDIGGIVIHDRVDAPVLPRHALVLGVAIDDPTEIAGLLGDLGRQDAAGLVIRAPVPFTDEVRAAAEASGVALLGLSRGAPWAHIATMLRSVLAEGDVGGPASETLGGLPSGDLFAVANAISSLLDAPVTIEDNSSRVLAFSSRQDEADSSRVETILGRQVPERYARILNERGVFRDLHRSDQPIYVDEIVADDGSVTLPRVAVAVRAGDEVLGSIWAAVTGPLSEARAGALRDTAQLVALHLLRVRAGADTGRRVRADLLSSVLEGGQGARESLERLGLADARLLVLACTLAGPGASHQGDPSAAHEQQRLADAFAMHLSAVNPRSASALIDGVAYGLVAAGGSPEEAEARATRIATDFLGRIGDRSRPIVAVGPAATHLSDIVRARATTDRILRVLREAGGSRSVARLADVQTESLLMELRDRTIARGEQLTGPLARLVEYDRQHDGQLVPTLQAWLDAFGDVTKASEALFVHTNTFRYRLRRVAEVGEVDLLDSGQRFALTLLLRLWPGLAGGAEQESWPDP
ncbi:PucR family transcriptional regulator [Aeromicrobium wangtongii]|uniref:Helix-turn-helix domain-containing protein n=1 Tax=Aeromicrobium wangtongii TaxID=2969247 RepID=A0ABY5M792_9ACTN|nr:helix-turn-helix domain-containing protein [Aeromicrobium wangtongii]MCD9199119.1 helix-turn-helix domain-containing protein [Aeromicrobium wangtongii]UUP12850.1 helix-turn-helix domain-containing protein [Aeromicrobium wangtongii]